MSERAGERRSVMWLFGALCRGAERAACGSNRLFYPSSGRGQTSECAETLCVVCNGVCVKRVELGLEHGRVACSKCLLPRY